MSYNSTIYCGWCYEKGHNRLSCEKHKEYIEKERAANPNSYDVREYDRVQASRRVRSCKYCGEEGHNRRSCKDLKEHLKEAHSDCSEWRKNALNAMDELGLGIGSLVLHDNEPVLVVGFDWDSGSHWAAMDMDDPTIRERYFVGMSWNVRPREPMMLMIKRTNPNYYRSQNMVPFPKHPVVAPTSVTTMLSPAPKSFKSEAPKDWVSDEPPKRVMAQFDPANW